MKSSIPPRGTQVFIWATGQDDNIGDSLLRRPAIEDARRRSHVLNVFHGASTPTFDTALGLQSEDVTDRSFRTWILRAWRSGFRQRTLIIPNAGEVRVSRRGSLRILSIWAASLAPKTRVLWIGAGVPGNSTVWAIPYKLLARRAKLATFRDTESTELLQYGGVTPDWAFLLGAGVDEWVGLRDRKKLAIVLRGDRGKPSDEWLGWVKMLTETLSLTPVFVAQVRRDNELAVELAGKLHGEALQFGDAVDHATQEAYVRETYSETRLVIGDRLHGLIVAATEGAVPLGWVESSTGKIRRHFNAAKMPFVGEFEGAAASELPAVSNVQLLEWRATLEARVAEARDEINATLVSADRVAERSAVTG